jgi:hydrogenase maturation protease
MSNERILVMGVGNPLMRDEGIGPRAIEMLLEGYDFPDNVEVVDAGTMGLSILDLFLGVDRLIVVDAVKDTGHAPGTVVVMDPSEIRGNQVMHSLHDLSLSDVLQNAELLGRAPQAVVIGVQIESIEQWVLELSGPAEAALPVAVAAVISELQTLGVEPLPREDSDVSARIIAALRSYEPMPES